MKTRWPILGVKWLTKTERPHQRVWMGRVPNRRGFKGLSWFAFLGPIECWIVWEWPI